MVTAKDCLHKYGDPRSALTQSKWLVLWDIPCDLEIGQIPKKLYCNKDIVLPLSQALKNLVQSGYVKEIHSWDGCWNIRESKAGPSLSLHSWGIAVDINAATNCFGCKPSFSKGFVQCFTSVGFDWGGNFTKPDGMHFQLAQI
jgi:hypothetical protein